MHRYKNRYHGLSIGLIISYIVLVLRCCARQIFALVHALYCLLFVSSSTCLSSAFYAGLLLVYNGSLSLFLRILSLSVHACRRTNSLQEETLLLVSYNHVIYLSNNYLSSVCICL